MNRPLKLIIDWCAACGAFWLMSHEGLQVADAISADGTYSGTTSSLIGVIVAALLTMHLLITALTSTATAFSTDSEETSSSI